MLFVWTQIRHVRGTLKASGFGEIYSPGIGACNTVCNNVCNHVCNNIRKDVWNNARNKVLDNPCNDVFINVCNNACNKVYNHVCNDQFIHVCNLVASTMWARPRLAVKMHKKMRFFSIFIIAIGGHAVFSRATARTPKWCAN